MQCITTLKGGQLPSHQLDHHGLQPLLETDGVDVDTSPGLGGIANVVTAGELEVDDQKNVELELVSMRFNLVDHAVQDVP